MRLYIHENFNFNLLIKAHVNIFDVNKKRGNKPEE